MADLHGKSAFITGASSGIGKACAERFAALGCNLILTARRYERLQELAEHLKKQYQVAVEIAALDVRDKDQVQEVVSATTSKQAVDILLNNAGLARGLAKIHEGNLSHWEEMLDTNIRGLLYVSRAILPGMVQRNQGQVINIGSIAGHEHYLMGNVYMATKHAVRALSKAMRLDLQGTAIRVSEIAPGAVETEFSEVRFSGDSSKAKAVYQGFHPLTADDIADNVVYCATRPAHVNIAELVVYPTAQAGVSIHRS